MPSPREAILRDWDPFALCCQYSGPFSSWAEILEVRVPPLNELLSSPLKHMWPFLSERVITDSIVQVALADNG